MWQKHHDWYFPDANFFIIINRTLFELHHWYFESLSLFLEILDYNPDYCIGQIPHPPIPFNNLKSKVFINFLPLFTILLPSSTLTDCNLAKMTRWMSEVFAMTGISLIKQEKYYESYIDNASTSFHLSIECSRIQ